MSKFQRVRGTRDLMPEDNVIMRFVEGKAHDLATKYGYGEISTPIFEFSDVFHRTLGETSDVVNKETYTFEDRGGESLTLRPEGTAGVARAFVSEGLAQKIPLKLYYSGPMFRYERPQKGRYRQFTQLGVECLGVESPLADVECLSLAWDFLIGIGIARSEAKVGEGQDQRCQLEINTLGDTESRAQYRTALVNYFTQFKEKLSADSQLRLEKNPLRILDSKDPGDRELIAGAPTLRDHLNETSKTFFDAVIAGIEKLKIPYKLNSRLVRGLDYYCHTVFEFTTTELGAQGTVIAGGRYDGLIETMGGPKTPGVGWAAGMDRLAELVPKELTTDKSPLLAIIGADEEGELNSLALARQTRKLGFRTENILSGKMGKKMQKAAKMGAHFALILGSEEVKNQTFTLKNLGTGEQKTLPLSEIKAELFTI